MLVCSDVWDICSLLLTYLHRLRATASLAMSSLMLFIIINNRNINFTLCPHCRLISPSHTYVHWDWYVRYLLINKTNLKVTDYIKDFNCVTALNNNNNDYYSVCYAVKKVCYVSDLLCCSWLKTTGELDITVYSALSVAVKRARAYTVCNTMIRKLSAVYETIPSRYLTQRCCCCGCWCD